MLPAWRLRWMGQYRVNFRFHHKYFFASVARGQCFSARILPLSIMRHTTSNGMGLDAEELVSVAGQRVGVQVAGQEDMHELVE